MDSFSFAVTSIVHSSQDSQQQRSSLLMPTLFGEIRIPTIWRYQSRPITSQRCDDVTAAADHGDDVLDAKRDGRVSERWTEQKGLFCQQKERSEETEEGVSRWPCGSCKKPSYKRPFYDALNVGRQKGCFALRHKNAKGWTARDLGRSMENAGSWRICDRKTRHFYNQSGRNIFGMCHLSS